MAPEHVFPIPVQDCVTATKYFLTNAARFDVDPTRVAIGGKYDVIADDKIVYTQHYRKPT
jgi:alpha/beta hydrolase fold